MPENSPSQKPLYDWLTERRTLPSHRQLLLLSGNRDWAYHVAHAIVAYEDNAFLWVEKQTSSNNSVSQSQYKDYLGQESDIVVFDGFDGFTPNALMGFAGLIRHSGLMVLLVPELELWPIEAIHNDDIQFSFGVKPVARESHFIHWLIQVFKADRDVAIVTPGQHYLPLCRPTASRELAHEPYRTKDQQNAVERLEDNLSARTAVPTMLLAERGRGKSFALGLAAAQLLKRLPILITAPSRAAAQPVFDALSKQGVRTDSASSVNLAGGHTLRFIAPDALMAECESSNKQSCDCILMVDEAAALSQHQLRTFCRHFSRIVFSTTSVGYEGSGRGFTLKFSGYLHEQFSASDTLRLNIPIRWLEQDSLERVLNNALLLADMPFQSEETHLQQETIRVITPEELLSSPRLLVQCFGLLINAHYQTTPDDLRRILDSPDHLVIASMCGSRIVGVVLGVIEGNSAVADVAEDIASGLRRPRGHLSIQSMAFELADPELARQQAFRIVRIAVNDKLRRQGVACRLTEFVIKHADSLGITLVTSSFGLSASLFSFWQSQGFKAVKLGLKRDNASGEHSLLIAIALDAKTRQKVDCMTQLCRKNIMHCSATQFQDISPDAILLLLKSFVISQPMDVLSSTKLKQVITGSRPVDSVKADIVNLLLHCKPDTMSQHREEVELLTSFALQHWPVKRLTWQYGQSGRKQLNESLKMAIKTLMEAP